MKLGHSTMALYAVPLLLFASVAAQSQTRPQRTPAPALKNIYGHFFTLVATIERDADDADKKGDKTKSEKLHKHFQQKLGLTDKDAASLKAHAKAADNAVRQQDAKAHDIIDKIRKKTPGGRLAPGEKPPAVPQELVDLQAGRDRMITDQIDGLHRDLGVDAFNKVDTLAKAQFAQAKPAASRKTLAPPRFPAKP